MDGGGWTALTALVVLFVDFNGKYDLYDALIHFLMK